MLTTDKKDRKERPIARGVLDYFPDAITMIANVSFVGNQQHNPGEPLRWAKEKSTDHADCIIRHLIDRGTVDEDGILHSAKVAWRALALLQIEIESKTKMAESMSTNGLDQAYTLGHAELDAPMEQDTMNFVPHGHDRNDPIQPGTIFSNNSDDDGMDQAMAQADARGEVEPVKQNNPEYDLRDVVGVIVHQDGSKTYVVNKSSASNENAMLLAGMLMSPFGDFANEAAACEMDVATLKNAGCKESVIREIIGGTAYQNDADPPYVYIAGPMRGYPEFNFPAFDEAAEALAGEGYNVISPAAIDRAAGINENLHPTGNAQEFDQRVFIYRDFYALYLIAHRRDGAIAMLPGWEKSTGATGEFFLARWFGLKILDARTGNPIDQKDIDWASFAVSVVNFLNSNAGRV